MRRPHLWLSGILVVSVVLRVGVALYLGDVVDAPPLLTDQRSYHALGERLVAGHGFTFDRAWYPFTPADTPTAHWSFLYSLFVGGVYGLLGARPLAVRLVQAVLGGLLLPWMVYRLSRRMFGVTAAARTPQGSQAIALVAAGITAVYGYFVLYAATLMTETFYIVALLWSLEASLDIVHRLYDGRALTALLGVRLGVSLGIAALLRQSILPWVLVLAAYLLRLGWRRGHLGSVFRVLGRAVLLLACCILPFTVRNYVAYGELLLLNSNAGFAMYSAQHPMHGVHFQEFVAAPLPDDLPRISEPQMDRDLMRRGIASVVSEPGRYLLLSLSRVRAFFEFWPSPDTTLLHTVGRTGSFGLFLPFMVYGLYLALRDRRWLRRNALLLLFVGAYTLLHVLTWAMVRYRLPVDAVLIPFAALGVVDLSSRMWMAVRDKIDGTNSGPAIIVV